MQLPCQFALIKSELKKYFLVSDFISMFVV